MNLTWLLIMANVGNKINKCSFLQVFLLFYAFLLSIAL